MQRRDFFKWSSLLLITSFINVEAKENINNISSDYSDWTFQEKSFSYDEFSKWDTSKITNIKQLASEMNCNS
jgi:hypothetical protein